jgi:hypothetical protein
MMNCKLSTKNFRVSKKIIHIGYYLHISVNESLQKLLKQTMQEVKWSLKPKPKAKKVEKAHGT